MRATREGRPTGSPDSGSARHPPASWEATGRRATRPSWRPACSPRSTIYPWFETPRHVAGRSPDEHREWLGRLGALRRGRRAQPGGVDARGAVGAGDLHRRGGQPDGLRPLLQADDREHPGRPGRGAVLLQRAGRRGGRHSARPGVFVHASAAAHDHWFVASRRDLHRSPAIAACRPRLPRPRRRRDRRGDPPRPLLLLPFGGADRRRRAGGRPRDRPAGRRP